MIAGNVESFAEITPEAVIGAAPESGWHVIGFSTGGWFVLGNQRSGKGERVLPVFRCAPDAEECIVQADVDPPGAHGDPAVESVSTERLRHICGVARSEGVRWYAINPPTTREFQGWPLSEFMEALHG